MEYITFRPIEKFLNKCGENYFFSTILIKENQYYFDDVNGCNKDGDNLTTCIYSVKDSKINSFYNQSHNLDFKTKNYLNSIEDNQIIFVKDTSIFDDKPAINQLLNSTIKKIELVWFIVKKTNNTVNKILIVTSIKPKSYCSQEVNRLLLRGE